MVQIIHISDFHLDSYPISTPKKRLVEALILDLEKQIIDTSKCIIAISGDLIDKGGYKFSSIKNAFESFKKVFIHELSEKLSIKKEQFFFVPGNHDIDRNKIDCIVESGIAKEVSTLDGINKFIIDNRKKSKYLDRIEDYKLFERGYYDNLNIKKELSNFDSCFLTDNNVGVACFNSVWRSSNENDNGQLILGEKQVEFAIDFLKDANVRIAIMHNPLTDLVECDLEKVKPILYRNFDVLLIGHKHFVDIEYTKNFHGSLLSCQSNASVADFSDDKYQNGYAIINFIKGGNTIIQYRKYLPDFVKFVSNTDVGTDDGCISIVYPDEKQIYRSAIIDKALDTLRNVRFENVNEHLFTYGLDPSIPCRINDLFVEPTITNIPETHSDTDNIKYYHISDFVNQRDNFLIYGLKESGKTTLLNKLLIEFTQNYKNVEYIPVIIDFNELGNRQINQLIRDYLAISAEEYRQLIEHNNFVLLIDEISFSEKEKITKVLDYIHQNPTCKIIAVKEQILENVLPIDFLDYNSDFIFNVVYIQNFKTQQIKDLIKKWFPKQSDDYKVRINKIIKNFEALSLPRTPLAVTLFLWIVEKQEKTPINNSLLVQQVVENLLEKTRFENVYQNKFNFQNKIRLLSFIAKQMEDFGDENYSYRLSYADLLDYIATYLKGKIALSPKVIVEDFVRRGILAFNDEDFVKFKFDFLFRYFLSLYINYDDNFKKKIFDVNMCLSYFDEIVYYSGLHTDNSQLLELSQKMLTMVFSDYNEDLLSNWEKIDSFLDTRKTLSSNISMSRIQKKPTERELEAIYDDELNNIPIKRSIEKRNITGELGLDKTLKFASLLFRNLEDIDDQDIRAKSLRNIIISSVSLMLLYRDSMVLYYLKHKANPQGFPKNVDFGVFIRLLPLLHQALMSDWLGTEKTKLIIKDKIDNHNMNLNISEYEKFIDIFIFADIKGKNYLNVVKNFLKKCRFRYIKDLSVIKLILYYYMRSNSKESDKQYLNLISDLKKQLKQIDDKGKYIQQLSINKKRNNKSSN